MIRLALKCSQNHRFDSWFQSSEAFDTLLATGLVTCPTCGASEITKSLMAPRVRPARDAARQPATPPDDAKEHPLSTPASGEEATRIRALAEMKAKIEANSDYVGLEFAREARAMHHGDAPERAIHGEAKADEARALIEEGVPVAPLPFLPRRKTN